MLNKRILSTQNSNDTTDSILRQQNMFLETIAAEEKTLKAFLQNVSRIQTQIVQLPEELVSEMTFSTIQHVIK